jgi:hypothetical protein
MNMNALNTPTSFFWRVTSAVLRRTGTLLTRVANDTYSRSLPGLSTQERKLIRANERFRNCHAGRQCFVIGNGPSIRKQDLSLLANEITFVMNAFWKHPIVEQWQPTYYLLSDPTFFDRSKPSKDFFDNLRTRINETTFMVSLHSKPVVEGERLLPRASTYYFALERRLLGKDSRENLDLTRRLPYAEVVAQLAIMVAIYMGCSPIYLMGQDCDWLSRQVERDYNFYDGPTVNGHPLVSEAARPYDLELRDLLSIWQTYRKLHSIAEKKGIKILNATEGGLLDVFERVSYQALFNHERELVSQS